MIQGNSTRWNRRLLDIHQILLGRIAVVWPRCSGRFLPGTLENPISDQLVLELRKDSVARRFIIVPQYKLLDEDLRGDVVTKGLVDIAIFFHMDDTVYLAFECKRLNVRYDKGRKSLAGEYSHEGVMRYVTAQYARRLPVGAMLGYVMDGDVDWAMTRLRETLERCSKELCLVESPADLPPADFIRCFQTLHRRPGEASSFVVRHGLLPLRCEKSSR